eukprot:m.2639 g.2639  ORF g.2639 m.2639 type:complete len:73 (-) comp3178_c0_seq1:36-254(-)
MCIVHQSPIIDLVAFFCLLVNNAEIPFATPMHVAKVPFLLLRPRCMAVRACDFTHAHVFLSSSVCVCFILIF